MNMTKSPVLTTEHEFDRWYIQNGGMPCSGDVGKPEHYPCIALLYIYTNHPKMGDKCYDEEFVQVMEYVYLKDFENHIKIQLDIS